MLKMLYRYENRYYAKIMPLCYLILAGILLICRLTVELFSYLESSLPEDSGLLVLIGMPESFMIMLSAAAVFAVIVIPLILLAVRFWKNLIRDGGYLSLTLPVKPQAHVGCKIITSFIWTVISALAAVLLVSAAVLILNGEAVDGLSNFIREMREAEEMTRNGVIFLIVSAAVSGLLLALTEAARIDFSMSIGQLTRKNKLLAAVGCWFGVGVVWRILSSMAYVVAMIPAIDAVDDSCELFDAVSVGLPFFIANAAVSLLIIIVGWCVSNYIFKNKINLE